MQASKHSCAVSSASIAIWRVTEEKSVQRFSGFNIVEQVLKRHSCAAKTRDTAQNFRIAKNYGRHGSYIFSVPQPDHERIYGSGR